jgi:hypothetical protein
VQVVSTKAAWHEATDELGQRFEISFNTYKPFACGIVIHPAIDACVQLRDQGVLPEHIARLEIRVHSLVLELTGKKEPADGLQAKFSVYHGCAAGLIFGRAGEGEFDDAIVTRDDVVALRRKVQAVVDPAVAEDAVLLLAELTNGRRIELRVDHAIGSLERPLSDAELDDKFDHLALPVIGAPRAQALRQACRGAAALGDVAELAWRRGPEPAVASACQHAQQPAAQCGHFLDADRVFHRVVVPLDGPAQDCSWSRAALPRAGTTTPSSAMGHEDRHVAVGRLGLGGGLCGQRQVARQAGQPGQPVRAAHAGQQRDRAALREARQHDALRRHAARDLAVDQRMHRGAEARSPASSSRGRLGAQDVVPGPHRVAVVDRDRPHRRAWQHPAHRADGGQVDLVGEGQEVGAVGAQAVQHDDAGGHLVAARDLDRLQGSGVASVVQAHGFAHVLHRLAGHRARALGAHLDDPVHLLRVGRQLRGAFAPGLLLLDDGVDHRLLAVQAADAGVRQPCTTQSRVASSV